MPSQLERKLPSVVALAHQTRKSCLLGKVTADLGLTSHETAPVVVKVICEDTTLGNWNNFIFEVGRFKVGEYWGLLQGDL